MAHRPAFRKPVPTLLLDHRGRKSGKHSRPHCSTSPTGPTSSSWAPREACPNTPSGISTCSPTPTRRSDPGERRPVHARTADPTERAASGPCSSRSPERLIPLVRPVTKGRPDGSSGVGGRRSRPRRTLGGQPQPRVVTGSRRLSSPSRLLAWSRNSRSSPFTLKISALAFTARLPARRRGRSSRAGTARSWSWWPPRRCR